MEQRIATIIGGSGFVGRYVVKHLAKQGWMIRAVARRPEMAAELKTAGDLGQIALCAGDLLRPETIAPHLDGAEAVINLVGLLFERSRQRFEALHTDAAGRLAQMAAARGIKTLVHMSAMGVDRALTSDYARTKAAGEKAVREALPNSTILRPGVIFGPEDNFFNQFARLSVFSPALPLIGGGTTKFQPVYVGDVAQAIATIVERPELQGRTYELAGPTVYTFREILEYILRTTGRKRALLTLPFPIANLLGLLMEHSPFTPMLTRDQVRLLHYDNVAGSAMPGLSELGIRARSVEEVVPEYLRAFRSASIPAKAGIL